MALLFTDTFESYFTGADATVFEGIYTFHPFVSNSEAGITSAGQTGKGGFVDELTSSDTPPIIGFQLDLTQFASTDDTWVVGFWHRVENATYTTPNSSRARLPLAQFLDSAGNKQITIAISSGNIVAWQGDISSATKFGFGTAQLYGNWHFIEVKVVFSTSALVGLVEAHVDGQQVLSLNAITAHTPSMEEYPTTLIFGGKASGSVGGFHTVIDGVYVLDGTGSTNNDVLGEVGMVRLTPNVDGTTNNFTPLGGGANYLEVDDSPDQDDDGSYNASSTVGHKDLYQVGNLASAPASILGVQVVSTVSTDSVNTFNHIVRSGTTEADSAVLSATTSYAHFLTLQETDPDTGSAWTEAGINSMEIGLEIVS